LRSKYFSTLQNISTAFMFAVSIIAVERKGWWLAPPTQTFLLPSGQLWYTPTAIKQLVGVPDRNMHRLHLQFLR